MPFTPTTLRFFRGLRRNNNKPWFEAHRDVLERDVRAPMRDARITSPIPSHAPRAGICGPPAPGPLAEWRARLQVGYHALKTVALFREVIVLRLTIACSLAVAASVASAQTPAGNAASADSAAALPTVVVNGRTISVPARYKDAYARAATGRGYYFTRADIETQNPRDLATMLMRVPAVQVSDRDITFQKCQQGLQSLYGPEASRVQVYIDDHRQTANQSPADVLELIRSIPPQSIELMEVYPSVSRIPGEYVNDACAVIVIWTKSY